MRSILAAVAVVAFIGHAYAQPATSSAPATQPNILIILSDDHSAAHVGCYGNADVKTPNLDKLASQGMRFDRAYVTAPQCVPSRASILTGRHPIDIGMTRFSAALPRDVRLFPETLRDHRNYFAGLCGRSFHLDGNGYNHPRIAPHLAEGDMPNVRASRLDYVRVANGEPKQLRAETVAQFEEFLGKVPAGRPFFLQVCWSDPHRPHTDEELPHRHDRASLTLPPFYPDSPPMREMLAAYYDEIGRMDGDTGRVLSILEKRGLAGNTIVVFMGDNGASQLRGKGTLNEFGVRVPLIIRWPGVIKPGASSDKLVSGDDLGPTFLAAAGLEPAKEMTGQSILPLLKGDANYKGRDAVFCERGPHGSALPNGSNAFDLGRTIITPQYKLIYNATWQLPYRPVDFGLNDVQALADAGKLDKKFADLYLAPQRPMFELYDLKADPSEMTNLAGKAEVKEIEADLKGRLAAWQIHHRDFVPLSMNLGRANRPNAGKAKDADE
jgi:arylsulfatase A-like enzyme